MKRFILFLLFFCGILGQVWAKETDITKMEQRLDECLSIFEKKEQKCSQTWRMECFNPLINAQKELQQCYKKTALDILEIFYGLSAEDAEKKLDEYNDFLYKQYGFIFGKTTYCKKNNCGISIYLYTEYATSQALADYVHKMINSVSARL